MFSKVGNVRLFTFTLMNTSEDLLSKVLAHENKKDKMKVLIKVIVLF